MKWVKANINEVIRELNVDVKEGLSTEEVIHRQEKYGLNEFEEAKKDSLLKRIIHHLLEITAIILMVAAAIAAVMAVRADGNQGWPKVFVILAIVVINTFLGVFQESRAEKALDALKKLNTSQTTVLRDGTKQKIDADQLVPGDIVEINAGDVITADARLIESSSLQVEESGLTGESVPVEKDPDAVIEETVPLGDRVNMVYSGCLATNGRSTAIVVETAMNTEMGKIAGLLNNTNKLKTPLQMRLHRLAKRLCIVALMAGLVMFLIGTFVHNNDVAMMLLLGVSLGVAAVPETLPIIVTMILSTGVHNMVKKNTIIRKIPAVETVGNTSVICSDKTGTLTQNKMKIQKIWHANLEPKDASEDFEAREMHLLELLTSCSNATIEIHDEEEKVVGDPTELAIIRLLHKKGLTRTDAERQYPRVHEIPFDSARKRMTTVHRVEDGYLVVTKGAFDRIPVIWDDDLKKRATKIHDLFAEKALRVIAIGCKKYDEMPKDISMEALERDLTLLGLVGMIDPPRPESAEAVCRAKEAGIKTVMITGDHVVTARAIAKEIGIYDDGDKALTGVDLNNMSEQELFEAAPNTSVYARVSPEDKINIVKAWEKHGEVIAMTGDGVNDAPALKAADVGAAMGITGTEVTKSAADMVITDDNFATIVDAVSEGRTSYDNIRKTVYFLLSVNFAQIFIMLFGVILFGRAPILALQILFINVVSDGIPGFFIAFEKAEYGIMKRKPLPKNAGIFASGLGYKIAQRSATFSVLTLFAYVIGSLTSCLAPNCESCYQLAGLFVGISQCSHNVGVSMAFIVLSWASVINIFNARSEQSIFKVGFLSNRGILFSSIFSLLLTALVALIPPVARVFDVVPLSGWHWLIMMGLASLQLFSVEIQKQVTGKNKD